MVAGRPRGVEFDNEQAYEDGGGAIVEFVRRSGLPPQSGKGSDRRFAWQDIVKQYVGFAAEKDRSSF
jgi:hypothetical protein